MLHVVCAKIIVIEVIKETLNAREGSMYRMLYALQTLLLSKYITCIDTHWSCAHDAFLILNILMQSNQCIGHVVSGCILSC